MKRLKKILLISALSAVLGTAGAFITSCGESVNNISISPSTNEVVNILAGEETTVSFKVDNYINDGEIFVSSSDDTGYSSGDSESAKIKFTTTYKGSGLTEVVVQGMEGGTATLIGKTKEGGNKTAQIRINIKEYSSSLTLKDSKVYVSPWKNLAPSADMFSFSNNSTERDLSYYFVYQGNVNTSSTLVDQGFDSEGFKLIDQEGEDDTLKCLEFISCELSEDKTALIFTQKKLNEDNTNKTFEISVYDTQTNYFIAEYDNGTASKLYQLVKFTTFTGLDTDNFKIMTEGKGEIVGINLVTYSTENLNSSIVVVRVPKSEDTQLCFNYNLRDEDVQKISVILDKVLNYDTYKEYYYKITSKIAKRDTAKINFNLYYNNFFGVEDESVSLTKELNVEIYVKPNSMTVNNVKQEDIENLYKLYNNNVGDYGWKKLKISVYAEDSSYMNCKLNFVDNIDVKQGNTILSDGALITDLSQPLLIRGKTGAVPTSGELSLTLNSPFDKDESEKIKYNVKYTIEDGATELKFTDEAYNYSSVNQSNGIYVSTTGGEVEFKGILVDKAFESATVKSLQNNGVAKVEYIGREESGGKYLIILKITPIKKGNDTYEIRLDNGKSINATIRVIETFDNVYIDKEGSNTNVFSFEKSSSVEGDDTNASIIIRNPYEENVFGAKAKVKISSNNSIDVIKSISVNVNQINVANVKETEDRGVFEITTNSNGESSVEFSIIGYTVNNFKSNDITKTITLNITSYKLAKEFIIKTNDKLANNLTLYTGENIDTNLSSKNFDYVVESADAFDFYYEPDAGYKTTMFSDEYVYWTSNLKITDESNKECDKMVYGKTYRIANIAEYNTKTKILSALPNSPSESFTIYATIRQYGLTRSFAVNVQIKSFDSVASINVSMSGTSISFTKTELEKSFVVTATPIDATLLDIDFIIEKKDVNKTAFISTVKKEEIKKGTWLITLMLDEGILTNESNYTSCVLKICAKDWITNGQIKDGKPYKSFDLKYQSGSEENPYILETPEDIIAIGSSSALLSSHYIISNAIDISAFADQLPLGKFTGSIIGQTASAKITGINIVNTKDNCAGLFTEITGKIENVAFEGSIDINLTGNGDYYIGLLAGKNSGELINTSSALAKSNIKCTGTLYFGGVVGENSGEITKQDKVSVIMNERTTIESNGGSVYAGGITGKNSGNIKDESTNNDATGYSGYLSYADISVQGSSPEVYIGGVAGLIESSLLGKNNGEKSIVGGRLHSNIPGSNVAGITASLVGSATEIKNFKVRTFVRGYNVGSIALLGESASIGNVFDIDVEEIDDGVSLNEEASMVVRYNTGDNPVDKPSEDKKLLSFIAFNDENSEKINSDIIFKSYSTRTPKEENGEFSFSNNISEYYGSYFEYDHTANKSHAQYWFTKSETDVVSIQKGNYSAELTSEGSSIKMFTAYYFKAEKYLDDQGKYTTVNLQDAQKKLDEKLNIIKPNDVLRPFSVSGGEITIKSDSSLVTIDNQNNFIINGTGVAKLRIYNTLNARESQDIYLYIVNFYNHTKMDKSTFFTYNGIRWGREASTKLISDENLVFNVAPNYRTTAKEITNLGDNFDISSEGEVYIDNMTIQLAPNEVIKTTIEENTAFEEHASYDISSNMVTISKKSVTIAKDTKDKITLNSGLSVNVDGNTYSYNYSNSTCDLSIGYYEGAKAIKSNYDSYVISSSSTQNDVIIIDSDDSEEKLNYIISNDSYTQSGEVTESANGGLFNIIGPSSGNKKNISITVNTASSEYKNRYTKNIFGEYNIRLTASSNQDTVYKDISLILDDRALDGIIVENYPDENERVSSQKIIPSNYGLLSITLSPADVDFKTFVIENLDSNYAIDSSKAFLEIGTLTTNGFNKKDGTVYSSKGVSISKEKLVDDSFDGQFYVRYLFSYTRLLMDGTNVGFKIKLIGNNGEEIYSENFIYKVSTEFKIYVSVDDKDLVVDDSHPNGVYYLAKGLQYGLTVVNNGFDDDSINITTSNPSLAQIVKENDKYYLKIVSREINYDSAENYLQIIVNGTRTNVDGKLVPVTTESNCQIMEYIFSIPSTTYGYDIVKNYEDGIISVAISGINKLSIDLTKYLEFDSSNEDVLNKVRTFMDSLSSNGIWTAYMKKDENAVVDWENKEEDPNITRLSLNNSKIINKYFEFDNLEYKVKIEHDPTVNKIYEFTFNASYTQNVGEGIYEITSSGGKKLNSIFTLATYIVGAEDTPNPITDYNNLKSMGANAHYILMNDIVITPETYSAINGIFASLDGNGKTITFKSGTYNLSGSELGVFSEISQDSVVKNLKVVFGDSNGGVNIFATTGEALVFGGVASKNSGIITNANVSGNLVIVNSSAKSSSFVAGIAGNNSGTITNSQVTASIRVNGASLAGITGTNSKIVASCYYRNGVLENITEQNTTFNTAGLINNNNENGQLITSYCAGIIDRGKIYPESKDSLLKSNVQVSGAVHSNKGVISDCYSSIIIETESNSAGFVFENSGKVKNCFSTSSLGQFKQTNYYFVSATSIADQGSGSFENCYYLKDNNINNSLNPLIVKGVSELNIEQFNDMSNFSTYAYGQGYNNVWMLVEGEQYPFTNANLVQGRLELVSANIVASSIRVSDGKEEADGKTTYKYKYEEGSAQPGTMLNPYIIYSSDLFEKYMNIDRDGYFRIVKNLDYNNVEVTTYKTNFYGIIEGNGMSITNIDITSGRSASSAGFIGSIKTSTNPSSGKPRYAGIMNLSLIPKIVNFPNVSVVGALVGTAENATIENISIRSNLSNENAQDSSTVIVSGKNIVGGVVGLVKNKASLKNIISTVGAKSTYIPPESARINITGLIYNGSNINSVSYAGNVVGYAYATSDQINIQEVEVYSTGAYAIADRAGFVFGGLSKNVTAKDITVLINDAMRIKAYSFGGLIVGENAGTLDDIVVVGSGEQLGVFSVSTYIPKAVGGIVGYMTRGMLNNVYMGQSFKIENVNLTNTIDWVGGIIGYVGSSDSSISSIQNTIMDGDISARNIVGGIVGYAKSVVDMNNIAIYKHTFETEGLLTDPYIGGFIGKNDNSVGIKNAYSLASLKLTAFAYTQNIIVNIGAILGSNEVNARLALENIYTITTYDVDIENKSYSGTPQKVSLKFDEEAKENVPKIGEKIITGLQVKIENKENSLFETDIDSSASVFNFIPTTEVNVLNSTTSLFVRADPDEAYVKFNYNQNEQGYAITQWYNKDIATEDSAKVVTPTVESYYNLIEHIVKEGIYNGNHVTITGYNPITKRFTIKVGEGEEYVLESDIDYGWTTPRDKDGRIIGLSTLNFEKSLRRK